MIKANILFKNRELHMPSIHHGQIQYVTCVLKCVPACVPSVLGLLLISVVFLD